MILEYHVGYNDGVNGYANKNPFTPLSLAWEEYELGYQDGLDEFFEIEEEYREELDDNYSLFDPDDPVFSPNKGW